MAIKLLKRGIVHQLFMDIEKNLNRYCSGDFDDILNGPGYVREIKDTALDENSFLNLNHASGGLNDAENAFTVFTALEGMTPYLARDERVWAYLTHTHGLDFTRNRWLKNQKDPEKLTVLIKSHFFARVGGERAFERNNALSSSWWWAYIASRYNKAPLRKTLEAFLRHTDLRSSIVERPTLSKSRKVFSALMDCVFRRIYEEPNPDFFARRDNTGIYREWLKSVNRHGGTRLFDALNDATLGELFERLAVDAEQNTGNT